MSAILVHELPVSAEEEILVDCGSNFKSLLIYKVHHPCRILSQQVVKPMLLDTPMVDLSKSVNISFSVVTDAVFMQPGEFCHPIIKI